MRTFLSNWPLHIQFHFRYSSAAFFDCPLFLLFHVILFSDIMLSDPEPTDTDEDFIFFSLRPFRSCLFPTVKRKINVKLSLTNRLNWSQKFSVWMLVFRLLRAKKVLWPSVSNWTVNLLCVICAARCWHSARISV